MDEPSYIMGIVSITPRVDYSQGNEWFVNLKTLDDLHKPQLDQIGFQDLLTEEMAAASTHVMIDGTVNYKSIGKQPAWLNYMTDTNKVFGEFAIPDSLQFMVLNRKYDVIYDDDKNEFNIGDATTYIDPAKFNYMFADTRLDAQNFMVQIGVEIEARRVMSSKIMPNL